MSMNHKDKNNVPFSLNNLVAEVEKLSYEISTSLDSDKDSGKKNTDIINAVSLAIGKYHKILDNVCVTLGYLLETVKSLLPQGEFGRWIADNCPFSHSTANNLMNSYRICLSHPELLALQKSVIYLMGSKRFPQKLLEQIAVCVVGGYEISRKEALQLQSLFINGKIPLDHPGITNYLAKQNQAKLFSINKMEWEKIISMLEKKVGRYKTLIANQSSLAGRKVNNEHTAYWESSIYIFQKTIDNLKVLCEGKIVKKREMSSDPIQYYDDNWVIDELSLVAGELTPDDFIATDNISEWELEQHIRPELCPDDFIAKKKKGDNNDYQHI